VNFVNDATEGSSTRLR